MSLGCQEQLASGTECGIAAVGRCRTCEKAICQAHRGNWALDRNQVVVETCEPCVIELQRPGLEAYRLKEARRKVVLERIKISAAALAVRQMPGLTERKSYVTTTGSLWWTKNYHDEWRPCWPVGTFTWHYPETRASGDEWRPAKTGVTANGDLVPLGGPHRDEKLMRKASKGFSSSPYGAPYDREWKLEELEPIADLLDRWLK